MTKSCKTVCSLVVWAYPTTKSYLICMIHFEAVQYHNMYCKFAYVCDKSVLPGIK